VSAAAVQHAFAIESGHPSLPGHFPGAPVVPGVLLLDQVADVLACRGGGPLARIGAVKFLAPLRPGEIATLHLEREGTRVRFRIERAGTAILRGDAEVASAPAGAAA
jgi:3-hydroxymyristoyl/3-hydroxydecanoyl-(acyl carrier protein) dehydratase